MCGSTASKRRTAKVDARGGSSSPEQRWTRRALMLAQALAPLRGRGRTLGRKSGAFVTLSRG
eukprot:scaffold23376_cov64-Phaeocystis_antarctica.AAC.3